MLNLSDFEPDVRASSLRVSLTQDVDDLCDDELAICNSIEIEALDNCGVYYIALKTERWCMAMDDARALLKLCEQMLDAVRDSRRAEGVNDHAVEMILRKKETSV